MKAFLGSGYGHTAAVVIAMVISWFLASGNPALTITFGTLLKLLYSDLVAAAGIQ